MASPGALSLFHPELVQLHSRNSVRILLYNLHLAKRMEMSMIATGLGLELELVATIVKQHRDVLLLPVEEVHRAIVAVQTVIRRGAELSRGAKGKRNDMWMSEVGRAAQSEGEEGKGGGRLTRTSPEPTSMRKNRASEKSDSSKRSELWDTAQHAERWTYLVLRVTSPEDALATERLVLRPVDTAVSPWCCPRVSFSLPEVRDNLAIAVSSPDIFTRVSSRSKRASKGKSRRAETYGTEDVLEVLVLVPDRRFGSVLVLACRYVVFPIVARHAWWISEQVGG